MVLAALVLSSETLAAAAVEPKEAARGAEPVAIDGMLCVTDLGLEGPELLPGAPVADGGGVPDCPVNFSNCVDVPGRKCTLQNCITEDLGYDKCRRPSGHIIQCRNGNIQQTTCDCRQRLQLICCDDESCGFECGICTGGSLSTVCP